jgi:hypothetical protein
MGVVATMSPFSFSTFAHRQPAGAWAMVDFRVSAVMQSVNVVENSIAS